MEATAQENVEKLSAKLEQTLKDPSISDALGGLVREELDKQIVAKTAEREKAARFGRIEGALGALTLTAGIAMGIAAFAALTPAIALTAVGAGVASTFGVLLGIAALGNQATASELDKEVKELTAARDLSKDRGLVTGIAQEQLAEHAPGAAKGKDWAAAVQTEKAGCCAGHRIH